MDTQFYLNWPAIIEEAKQRRKAQRLTQAQLASLAKVSTPTLSRFEGGQADIQLSSVVSILKVLGMIDSRELTFPDADAYYDVRHRVVRFTGQAEGKTVHCAISGEALNDHFHGDGKDPLKVFRQAHARIEHEARRKYLVGRREMDGGVLVKTEDL